MARSKRRNREKPILSVFLATSFIMGLLLGAVITSIWMQGAPVLQLSPDETYKRSITIVGVDKNTGEGKLATLTVELMTGDGDLSITVPPYENEDTQEAALNAKNAAELVMNRDLSQVDIVVSIENLASNTTITGPSCSAALSVLVVAAARASENTSPNIIRQDAVVSAAIDSTGGLDPVGEIEKKYQAVQAAGGYSLFVVARTQSGYLLDYPDISVDRARNLDELATIILL